MTTLLIRKLVTFLLVFFLCINAAFADIEPVYTGSFIINMGVVPQTYANGLKPYGMIYDLIKNYKVPIKWVISQTKVKDGTDFTYNGTSFKGGTFIIPQKNRSYFVDSVINYWQSLGVVGVTTTSDFNVDVTYTLKYNPIWTFDFQNGNIALNYLTIAGIPTPAYPKKNGDALNGCDDIFVLPHADPTWPTHNNILAWNKNTRGWLWYGCHAGSVMEDLINPADSTQQMDFLTTNGLVNFADHANPSVPYNYRFDTDPVMQFMGTVDAAVTNGSEQVYLPKLGGGWRTTTKVGIWDPSQTDIPTLSPGEGAILAHGRAFGDSTKGEVMFQAGHNFDKGNSAAVAAIRAFFNFSYLSVLDKIVTPIIAGPISCQSGIASVYKATLPPAYAESNYYFHWTSSCSGTFSDEFKSSTSYSPSGVGDCSNCTLTVTIRDGCGREYYQTIDLNVCGIPPVALNRTSKMLLNPPGTSAQQITFTSPLAGTDVDGYIANYVITSLPANGTLFYDHDNNPATADIAVTTIPAGGFILTTVKMKSLKFDPVDGFGGTTSFQYIVQDNKGLLSQNTATYTIQVTLPQWHKILFVHPL